MVVRGFHIKDDGTRAAMSYGNHHERVHCECGELVDHEHYEEAYEKIEELYELNNGFILKGDWKLVLQVEMGYLSVKPTKKNFENTLRAWASAASHDGGSDIEGFVGMANTITEIYAKRHKIPVNYDDFSKANVQQTVQLLDFIYDSFLEPGADRSLDLHFCEFLEPSRFGIRHLAVKGEKKLARAFFDKISTVGSGDYESEMKESEDWMMNEED